MRPAAARISGAIAPAAPSIAQRPWITSLRGGEQQEQGQQQQVGEGALAVEAAVDHLAGGGENSKSSSRSVRGCWQ